MDLNISFETNHIRMDELWLHAYETISSIDGDEIPLATWLYPSVVSTMTLFASSREECKQHLAKGVRCVLNGDVEAYGDAIYFLPRAITRYFTHTGVLLIPEHLLDNFIAFYNIPIASSAEGQVSISPLLLGGYLDAQRLTSLYGRRADPDEISLRLQAYYAARRMNGLGICTDDMGQPLVYENLYSAYFDFMNDDSRSEIGSYVALSSFEILPKDKHILFEALMGLEMYDALFASLLEAGKMGSTMEELSAFLVALVGGICGVSFEAVTRGRFYANPHAPFDMSYRLLIPYHAGVMVFSKDAEIDENY